nr:uncharacterized protein LOC117274071 [Nicotiana tomentosiformis]
MANNLEFFMKYPWGKESFELTIEYFKKDMFLMYKSYVIKRRENNISGKKSKSASYAMYGFPWAFMEVHHYLIPTLREMDMDYMKNLVPYDDEVADPIVDQLAVDLEWVTAIKKAPSAVSLETNDEADIAQDDLLGRSILGSPLVGIFSDIGRGGPCRMCNAQPSDTDVSDELKVVNEKLDKVLKILGEMKN